MKYLSLMLFATLLMASGEKTSVDMSHKESTNYRSTSSKIHGHINEVQPEKALDAMLEVYITSKNYQAYELTADRGFWRTIFSYVFNDRYEDNDFPITTCESRSYGVAEDGSNIMNVDLIRVRLGTIDLANDETEYVIYHSDHLSRVRNNMENKQSLWHSRTDSYDLYRVEGTQVNDRIAHPTDGYDKDLITIYNGKARTITEHGRYYTCGTGLTEIVNLAGHRFDSDRYPDNSINTRHTVNRVYKNNPEYTKSEYQAKFNNSK